MEPSLNRYCSRADNHPCAADAGPDHFVALPHAQVGLACRSARRCRASLAALSRAAGLLRFGAKLAGGTTALRRRSGLRVLPVTALLSLAVSCACGGGLAQQAPPPRNGAVTTDRDAYVLLPPELIAGPVVQQTRVSPSLSNVAVLRTSARVSAADFPSRERPFPDPPREEQELIFWNAATRRPNSLWRSAQPRTRVTFSEWMPRTETLYAVVDREFLPETPQPGQSPQHEWKVLLLGLGVERAVPLPVPTGAYDFLQVEMSPLKPVGVLHVAAAGNPAVEQYYLVHPNARLGARIELPGGGRGGLIWDANGDPVFVQVEGAGGDRARTYLAVDPPTGRTRVVPAPPRTVEAGRQPTAALPLRAVARPTTLADGSSAERIRPLWLEGIANTEYPRALLVADGANVRLLPDASGAVYSAHGGLWFTPIIKMNRSEYVAGRRAAERAVALSKAKQVGLAAMMYAQDYDETLPGGDGVNEKLAPYLRDDSLLDGFTYTFGGSRLSDIAAPAETVLGYISAAGGRAVLYADGHAKWQSD